jgi:replication factor C subunit 3/5
MSSLPWIEKYRPITIDGIVSHTIIKKIIEQLIDNKKFPHLLLYGPPGTGKTTIINACINKLYGDSSTTKTLELNASDDRGIETVRDVIISFATSGDIEFTNKKQSNKFIILDEVDLMTFDAQFALQNVMEDNIYGVRFCLICNYSYNIIKSITSRCSVFMFSTIPKDDHIKHIENIASKECMKIDNNVISHIVDASEGDMRRSLSIMQSLKMMHQNNHITLDMLYKTLLTIPPVIMDKLMHNLINLSTIKECIEYLNNIKEEHTITAHDLLIYIIHYLLKNKIYNELKTAKIIIELGIIEENLSGNCNNKLQDYAIISSLKCIQ